MPWVPEDAQSHTHKATSRALKELWAKIANECLERTGDEGRAIREANAVIARRVEGGLSAFCCGCHSAALVQLKKTRKHAPPGLKFKSRLR